MGRILSAIVPREALADDAVWYLQG